MIRVHVNASSEYDVLIEKGINSKAGELIAKVKNQCKAALISDDIVDKKFGDDVARSLKSAGFKVCRFVFKNGKAQKQ
jgi:3-dehydroquinate synthase